MKVFIELKKEQTMNKNKDKTTKIYRKTICGEALQKAMEDSNKGISESMREKILLNFDRAVLEVLKETSDCHGNIKGDGSYRGRDGEFWSFTIEHPQIKVDSTTLNSAKLSVYAQIEAGNEKRKTKKKDK